MAYTTASLGPHQGPMAIDDIIKEADELLEDYTSVIPLKFWLRSAETIQKQAQSYERDGNDQEAFKFYYRHALLVMNKLSSHPGLKDPQNQVAWKKARTDVNNNLARMEDLKPRIKERYQQHLQMIAKRRAEREKIQQEQRGNTYNSLVGAMDRTSLSSQYSGGYPYNRIQELDATANPDIVVKLAHKELRENRASRLSRYHMEPPPRRSSGIERPRREPPSTFFSDESEEDLTKNMVAAGQRRDQAFSKPVESPPRQRNGSSQGGRAFHYPSVPKQTDRSHTSWYGGTPTSSPKLRRASPSSYQSSPPIRPPKEYFEGYSNALSGPPPIPDKHRTPSPPAGIVEAPDTSPKALDSRNYTFKPTSFTESGGPLRTVFINPKLRHRFLTIALANTERNLETCGILCGELMSNAFFVSKLVIPEQEGTSDTCEMVNEAGFFDYCDSENLMTLGWIHTHPTQTCFMSSRDLHTHGAYQVQLAESVAIVCAPKHSPSWGIFRLTDPPGLSAILTCRQTGVFHPHAEKNIYTDALQPGHVREVENLPFDVVDLRPESTWI